MVIALLGKVAALEEKVAAQAEEILRLKGLKGKPQIKPSKPSGMDKAAERQAEREWRKKRRRGAKTPTPLISNSTLEISQSSACVL